MSGPLFSIITACFNAERTLPRTLASLQAQTFRDFEWVVADGGSTDGTLALLQQATGLDARVESRKDRGISDAFNKGLARARGRYVAMLNADDWYNPDTLARVADAVAATGADVVCGRLQYVEEDGRPGAVFGARPELLRRFMSVNHMAMWARRGLFEAHGGFREDYKAAMDYELALRFHARGARFHVEEHVLANMSLGGVSDRKWRLALREVRRAQRELGVGRVQAWAQYAFSRAKGEARRGLDKVGGDAVVALYRERLASVRKTRG